MPRPSLVALQDILKDRAFVVGLEINLLQPRMAEFVHAHVVLRPEFDGRLDLATDDRTDVGLGDADNPLRDAVLLLVEHLLLLGVELADRRQ